MIHAVSRAVRRQLGLIHESGDAGSIGVGRNAVLPGLGQLADVVVWIPLAGLGSRNHAERGVLEFSGDDLAADDCRNRFCIADLVNRTFQKILRHDDEVGQFAGLDRTLRFFFK